MYQTHAKQKPLWPHWHTAVPTQHGDLSHRPHCQLSCLKMHNGHDSWPFPSLRVCLCECPRWIIITLHCVSRRHVSGLVLVAWQTNNATIVCMGRGCTRLWRGRLINSSVYSSQTSPLCMWYKEHWVWPTSHISTTNPLKTRHACDVRTHILSGGNQRF